MKVKEIIMPAFKLLVICVVSAFLLAGTNYVTKGKIAATEQAQEQESKQTVFSVAESFGENSYLSVNDKEVKYCTALGGNGDVLGFVFTSATRGYGGDVTVMTGIDINGTVLKTVILSMDDETPGLGQNASKENFISQFYGKQGPFTFSKNGGEGNNINGVTSATFTSKAVIESVNDALDAFNSLDINLYITGGAR